MFSAKKLFVAAILVAVSVFLLGTPAANAGWLTPTAVWDTSPSDGGSPPPYMIDNNLNTYYKSADDSPPADETDLLTTGYVILDLGAKQNVEGFKFWPRIHASAATGPKDVDFFYFQDEALKPADGYSPNTTATLALDSNVIVAASRTLPGIHGTGEFYETAFSSGETFQAQYVGIRFNSGYDTPPGAVNQIAEVQFNTSPVPEPSTVILLATGLIGLLCYAWRKRK